MLENRIKGIAFDTVGSVLIPMGTTSGQHRVHCLIYPDTYWDIIGIRLIPIGSGR